MAKRSNKTQAAILLCSFKAWFIYFVYLIK